MKRASKNPMTKEEDQASPAEIEVHPEAQPWHELPREEKSNAVLLIVLYMLQGIPLGLVFGTLPFVFKSVFTYTQLGTFSLAGYPFSLKLLWSPIVDSVFIPRIGRRKSWIVPTQILLGFLFIYCSYYIEDVLTTGNAHAGELAVLFFVVIFTAATQDIAVDGWALTLLSKRNVKYASTCETVGWQIGVALSFTLFLPLNSAEFCNNYLRSDPAAEGLVGLGQAMRFWAVGFFLVSIWLLFFKTEVSTRLPDDLSITAAYRQMWKVLTLPSIKQLLFVYMINRVGFIACDALTTLKLADRGFKKEQLAFTSFVDFPAQMMLGIFVVRYSQTLKPWFISLKIKIGMCIVSMALVALYPGPDSSPFFALIVLYNLASSFTYTAAHVAQGAFFARISDPVIGGTYATLLNTASNFGGTWPKWFVFAAVDLFTYKNCADGGVCTSVDDCGGDSCNTTLDGFYVVSILGVMFASIVIWKYTFPIMSKLDRLPKENWLVFHQR